MKMKVKQCSRNVSLSKGETKENIQLLSIHINCCKNKDSEIVDNIRWSGNVHPRLNCFFFLPNAERQEHGQEHAT